MGSIFKAPKMPDPAPIQMPSTDDVPDVEDEALAKAEEEAQRKRDRNRKGRRSTILTTGLNEIEAENLSKKTLLG
jgi:hypothetical protein